MSKLIHNDGVLAVSKDRKKYWLFPIVLILLALGALMILTEGSALAPFIYAIF